MGRLDDDRLMQLLERAERAPFTELVSLLERVLDAEARAGGEGPPDREGLAFRNDTSLGFPVSDVRRASLEERRSGARFVELTTTFLGLTGQASPLPSYLPEEVLAEDPSEAPRRDFLDMFHHRLIGLLYRGSTRLQHYRHFQRGAADRGSRRALCFGGVDAEAQRPGRYLTAEQRLSLTPLLGLQAGSRHAVESGLRALFGDELGERGIRLVAFTGGDVELSDNQRARLGVSVRLGRNGTLGRFVPHRASAVRVELGPLSDETFARFGPEGELHGPLREAVELLLHGALDYEISLQPEATERAGFALSSAARVPLGRTSWLRGPRARSLNLRFQT